MQLRMPLRTIYPFHIKWAREPQELTLQQKKQEARKENTVSSKLFPFLLETRIRFAADHLVTLRHFDVTTNALSLLLNI